MAWTHRMTGEFRITVDEPCTIVVEKDERGHLELRITGQSERVRLTLARLREIIERTKSLDDEQPSGLD